MKTWTVRLEPDAQDDLDEIEMLIAARDTPTSAARYIDRILEHCEGLQHFPERGAPRDELGPGIRVLGFEKRLSIAVRILGEEVLILRVFYAGQTVKLSRD